VRGATLARLYPFSWLGGVLVVAGGSELFEIFVYLVLEPDD
jgi:hypothetical protein